jgi:hypothetical protein
MRQKIARGGRLLLRKILTGLSLGAVSLVFQACYGDPGFDPNYDWDTIEGTVKSAADAEPIQGIRVSVIDTPEAGETRTVPNGNYQIYVPNGSSYMVQFEDVDGPLNGGEFQPKIMPWSGKNPLDVELELKN